MHDPGVRVALEAVAPFPQPQHEALRPCELHAREDAVETGPTQVEVMNIRAVGDDKAVRRARFSRFSRMYLWPCAERAHRPTATMIPQSLRPPAA